jgi:hypothetical protein
VPPRGVSTARSRAASKKNGAAGAKHGKKGGRPRGRLVETLYERLGEPPIDHPLKLARWWTKALALIASQQMQGVRGLDKLAREIRAGAAVAGKVLPHDIMFEAARRLNEDEDDMDADAGGDLEDVADGDEDDGGDE